MGIGAVGAAGSSRVQVEAQRTAVSRADIRGALARAHEKVTGQKPSQNLLDTLTAQASLETASGGSMYNYNFGGIKGGAPGTNETARLRTKEVYDGKEVEVRDGFRAYRSLDDGAEDYVRLMRKQFGGALERAEKGDLDGFAHKLKEAHYFTADESKYASALHTLAGKPEGVASTSLPTLGGGGGTHFGSVNNFSNAIGGLGGTSSSNAFPDTVELGRVFDAIARHPTPPPEDDE